MARNRFIDSQGRVFFVESLIGAASDLKIIECPINREWLMEQKIEWQLENLRDFTVHFQKVLDADLNQPLILRSDGYPMDGWHRIAKALIIGRETLPAKQFIVDPEPDYIIKNHQE